MGRKKEQLTTLQNNVEALEDEVKRLTETVTQKQLRILELDRLTFTYERYVPPTPPKPKKNFLGFRTTGVDEPPKQKKGGFLNKFKRDSRWFGTVSLDFYPLRDWFRFSYEPYRPGQYFQICIGPLRFDFAAT